MKSSRGTSKLTKEDILIIKSAYTEARKRGKSIGLFYREMAIKFKVNWQTIKRNALGYTNWHI